MDWLRELVRPYVPRVLVCAKHRLLEWAQRVRSELPLLRFVYLDRVPIRFRDRRRLAQQFRIIQASVTSGHTHAEMVEIVTAIASLPATMKGCLVEAGCFKGASAAKLSLVARLVGRPLVLCDSFDGIPDNTEPHTKTVAGGLIDFRAGQYRRTLDEVRENIRRFGDLSACRFIKGWFEDTPPWHFGNQSPRRLSTWIWPPPLTPVYATCIRCWNRTV